MHPNTGGANAPFEIALLGTVCKNPIHTAEELSTRNCSISIMIMILCVYIQENNINIAVYLPTSIFKAVAITYYTHAYVSLLLVKSYHKPLFHIMI